MNSFEKKALPLALLASITACEQTNHDALVASCLEEDREVFTLELHTTINDTEERYRNQRGQQRAVNVLGDLLRDTQTCPISSLVEAATVFDFAYKETGDQHFARQRDIVQALVDIRRTAGERDLGPQPPLEDTI